MAPWPINMEVSAVYVHHAGYGDPDRQALSVEASIYRLKQVAGETLPY